MVGEVAGAASAAVAANRNRLLQLHECKVRCHIWGGAGAGHLWGRFLFQTERQGLQGLCGRGGQTMAGQVGKRKAKMANEPNGKLRSEMSDRVKQGGGFQGWCV